MPAPLAWHTLWTFRAEDGLDVCKGNQVADGPAGKNVSCPVFETRACLPLRPERVWKQHNPGTFPLVCSPLD